MIRVGVVGAGGRMGQEVCRAVIGAEGLELVAAVDPRTVGIDLRQVVGGDVPSIQMAGELAAVGDGALDVAVDFTEAAAARHNLEWCAAHGVHAVVGTTGLSEEDVEAAGALFDGSSANAVIASNFAIGAVLLMRLCELAAPFMDGVEIIELHHDAKRDAPSGTAMQTAERIAAARRRARNRPFSADPTRLVVLEGARGGQGPEGVRVHSVRLPGLVAHQEVIFGAAGQSLTVRHDAYDRTSFMAGVLLAVRQVGHRPGLTVGLDALLGF